MCGGALFLCGVLFERKVRHRLMLLRWVTCSVRVILAART